MSAVTTFKLVHGEWLFERILDYLNLTEEEFREKYERELESNSTVYEGDSIEVKLTDLNNTSLSGKMINISVVNNNSTVISVSNITDNEGCVKLKLNCTEGNYTMNCSFAGDENYTSNSTSENLIVKKEVVEEDNTGNHYSSSSGRSNEEVVEWKKAVLGKDYDAKADPYNCSQYIKG